MIEDASRNPEADSNYYIHLLMESLNKMDRLDAAIESIEQRLPVELRRVVDKTNKEVDQRHPSSMRGSPRQQSGKIDLGLGENNVRAIIVFDLLWTLYSKFEAIAEGHRVLHDVVTGIVKRDGIKDADSLTGGFNELWKLYQSEVGLYKHYLVDSYLTTLLDAVPPPRLPSN
jgi:exocyst complex component 4